MCGIFSLFLKELSLKFLILGKANSLRIKGSVIHTLPYCSKGKNILLECQRCRLNPAVNMNSLYHYTGRICTSHIASLVI